jgi:hypothetical protein
MILMIISNLTSKFLPTMIQMPLRQKRTFKTVIKRTRGGRSRRKSKRNVARRTERIERRMARNKLNSLMTPLAKGSNSFMTTSPKLERVTLSMHLTISFFCRCLCFSMPITS